MMYKTVLTVFLPCVLALSACAAETPEAPNAGDYTAAFADQKLAVCAALIETEVVDECDMLEHVRVLVREPGHIGYGCRRGQDVCYQTEAQAIYVDGPDANANQVAREYIRAAMDQLDLNDRGQNGGYSDLFVQIRCAL